jgi:peptide/nickel transport system permease protein
MWSSRFRGVSRVTLLGLVVAGVILLVSASAPLVSGHDPLEQSAVNRLLPPDWDHLLGRDAYGRDVVARLLYAGRVSLTVGLASVALGGGLGTLLGMLAGSTGRFWAGLLMRLVDVLMSFPSLLLGLLVLAVLGAGLEKLVLSIGLVLVPPFVRVVHATTLSLVQREFVEAARSVGAGRIRILRDHLLPNLVSQVLALGGVSIAAAIRIEASLSFIGLGVSPPTPTWGNMIRDGVPLLLTAPWLAVAPTAAILVTVVAFSMLGDGVQDLLDRRSAVPGSR